ncbi:MAG: carboxypeptidase-like regulatory domain-containing protein, partial [Gammaproteobacteria bacterium]
EYPGVAGCGVEPVYRWNYPAYLGLDVADPYDIETMYPFIEHSGDAAEAMSYLTSADDAAAISDLYPTPDYASSTGSISGTLYLKDGKTEYSGVNVVARNVNDLMGDAVSAMTGYQTQGKVGPDGRYRINNLTPGEQYVVYIESIRAGGYPTSPQSLVSVPEYWNAAEGTSPATDQACDATPIVAEAGVEKTADIYFNGYPKGIEFRQIISGAFLVDLAKNGRSAMGTAGSTPFVWDENFGFRLLSDDVSVGAGSMTRNGQKLLVLYDDNGNGIQQAALWTDSRGPVPLGDLNGDTCGGSGSAGVSSSYGWAVDDTGATAVGTAYIDVDSDGSCQSSTRGEIVPFKWTKKTGMQQLETPEQTYSSWVRAHGISGNGEVILGGNGPSRALAWVNGDLYNLYEQFGSRSAYAANFDGTTVALNGTPEGVMLWDPINDPANPVAIGGLEWCKDLDYVSFGRNFCDLLGPEAVQAQLGPIPVEVFDMSDDGSVLIGRAGSFFAGFVGGIWIEGIGWMNFSEFFAKQGVAEAASVPFDNPIAISGTGREITGGIAGATAAWHVDIDQVFVCRDGADLQTGFPNGLREELAAGAEFGRCAHLDD